MSKLKTKGGNQFHTRLILSTYDERVNHSTYMYLHTHDFFCEIIQTCFNKHTLKLELVTLERCTDGIRLASNVTLLKELAKN